MSLGEKIKKARQSTGMTLCQFSKKTGISKSYLHNLESGKSDNLSFSKLQTIANHACISIDFFIDGLGDDTFTTKNVIWEKYKKLSYGDQLRFADILDIWANPNYPEGL